MKQIEDDKTLELLDPVKRGRGRPSTGAALTAAERKARQRARRLEQDGVKDITVAISLEAIDKLKGFIQFKDLTPGQVIDRLILQQLARKR